MRYEDLGNLLGIRGLHEIGISYFGFDIFDLWRGINNNLGARWDHEPCLQLSPLLQIRISLSWDKYMYFLS
jgi:hypothetical protein